jgi:hypothetical protein
VTACRFPPPWSVEDIGAAYDEEPGRRDGSGTVKEKSPGNRPGSEFSLRTFPTVRRKNSSSKYNVRVAPLMLWRLPTGDPLDLDKN